MIGLLTTGRHDKAYLIPLYEALGKQCKWIPADPLPSLTKLHAASSSRRAIDLIEHEFAAITRLVVLGDRAETALACCIATIMRVPIAHIHGGEVTEGAIDNVFRNAISQMADIHFCAHEIAANRLRAMHVPGEIIVSGSPSIDLIKQSHRIHCPCNDVVLSYHPETMSDESVEDQIKKAMRVAVENLGPGGIVWCVGANPDAGGETINRILKEAGKPFAMATGLSPNSYWDLLCMSRCLVGNSSSGVIECPALGVPFVEVGDRQKGRDRCSYGDGKATERIVARLLRAE